MPHITELPVELFAEVLTSIRRPDLAALNSTCSSIRERTSNALYGDIEFVWEDKDADPPPIGLLLRSVIDNSQLVPHVRALSIRGRKPYESWDPNDHPKRVVPEGGLRSAWVPSAPRSFSFDTRQRKQALDLVALASPTEGEKVHGFFDKGEVDVLIAMLILKCVKLERLVIDKDYFNSNFIDRALHGIKKSHLDLKTLQFSSDLTTLEDAYFASCPFNSILLFLELPNLQYLSASLPSRPLSWSGRVPVSSLKTLELHHTRLPDTDLGVLLKATPQLTRLKYHALYDYDDGPRGGSMRTSLDCASLENSLKHVQHSLEGLSISIRFYTFNGDIRHIGLRPIVGQMNLHDFKKLKMVEIPYVLLLTWYPPAGDGLSLGHLLPSTLTSLTLTDDADAIDTSGWSPKLLAKKVEEFLPLFARQEDASLEPSIKFRAAYEGRSWTPRQQSDLVRCCLSAGVACSFDIRESDQYVKPRSTRQHRLRGRLGNAGRGGTQRVGRGG